MRACLKECVRQVLPTAGLLLIVGIVVGILLFISATGGAGAVLALGAGAIAVAIGKIVGGVLAADALGTLIGCILHCL